MILSDEGSTPFSLFTEVKNSKDYKCVKVGAIEDTMDKAIGRSCVSLKGTVSANNYVDYTNLQLTKPYFYIQLNVSKIPNVATFHIELITLDDLPFRISVSTLYKEPRFLCRQLRVPLPLLHNNTPATPSPKKKMHTSNNKSVTAYTNVSNAKSGWLIIELHINDILSRFCGESNPPVMKYIKRIQLCSSMQVRDVLTSSHSYYHPQNASASAGSVAIDWKKTFPKELLIRPQSNTNSKSHVEMFYYDALTHHCKNLIALNGNGDVTDALGKSVSATIKTDNVSVFPTPCSEASETPCADRDGKISSVSEAGEFLTMGSNDAQPHSPQEIGLDAEAPHTKTDHELQDLLLNKCDTGSETKKPTNVTGTTLRKHRAYKGTGQNLFGSSSNNGINQVTDALSAPTVDRIVGYDGSSSILFLYDGQMVVYPCSTVLVLIDINNITAENESLTGLWKLFYPIPDRESSVTVHYDNNAAHKPLHGYKQAQLYGHQAPIGIVDTCKVTNVMVSCESVVNGQMFIWDMKNVTKTGTSGRENKSSKDSFRGSFGKISVLRPHAGVIQCVSFSPDGTMLVTVGTDAYHRTQIIVWDLQILIRERIGIGSGHNDGNTRYHGRNMSSASGAAYTVHRNTHITGISSMAMSAAANGGMTIVNSNSDAGGVIIAKQISDFPISSIRFSPFEEYNLISCGRENIRFWRMRKGHLPGRPVCLNQYARGVQFTDLVCHSCPAYYASNEVDEEIMDERVIGSIPDSYSSNYEAMDSHVHAHSHSRRRDSEDPEDDEDMLNLSGHLDSDPDLASHALLESGRNARMQGLLSSAVPGPTNRQEGTRNNHKTNKNVPMKDYNSKSRIVSNNMKSTKKLKTRSKINSKTIRDSVFVISDCGILFRIDYHTEKIVCSYQLHTSAITSIGIHHDGQYMMTGGADKMMRVWPWHFSDYILESQHESMVTRVQSSSDGSKICIGTNAITIGVLDMNQHSYHTLVRGHSGPIHHVNVRDGNEYNEIVTLGSMDHTIRIYDLLSGQQRFEFSAPQDIALCSAYHPTDHHLVCGFESGYIRVFEVESTTTLVERCHVHHTNNSNHSASGNSTTNVSIIQVLFSAFGEALFVATSNGYIHIYDVHLNYTLRKVIKLSPIVHSSNSQNNANSTCNAVYNTKMCLSKDAVLLCVSYGNAASLSVYDTLSGTCWYNAGLTSINNNTYGVSKSKSAHLDGCGGAGVGTGTPNKSLTSAVRLTTPGPSPVTPHNIDSSLIDTVINDIVCVTEPSRFFGEDTTSDKPATTTTVYLATDKYLLALVMESTALERVYDEISQVQAQSHISPDDGSSPNQLTVNLSPNGLGAQLMHWEARIKKKLFNLENSNTMMIKTLSIDASRPNVLVYTCKSNSKRSAGIASNLSSSGSKGSNLHLHASATGTPVKHLAKYGPQSTASPADYAQMYNDQEEAGNSADSVGLIAVQVWLMKNELKGMECIYVPRLCCSQVAVTDGLPSKGYVVDRLIPCFSLERMVAIDTCGLMIYFNWTKDQTEDLMHQLARDVYALQSKYSQTPNANANPDSGPDMDSSPISNSNQVFPTSQLPAESQSQTQTHSVSNHQDAPSSIMTRTITTVHHCDDVLRGGPICNTHHSSSIDNAQNKTPTVESNHKQKLTNDMFSSMYIDADTPMAEEVTMSAGAEVEISGGVVNEELKNEAEGLAETAESATETAKEASLETSGRDIDGKDEISDESPSQLSKQMVNAPNSDPSPKLPAFLRPTSLVLEGSDIRKATHVTPLVGSGPATIGAGPSGGTGTHTPVQPKLTSSLHRRPPTPSTMGPSSGSGHSPRKTPLSGSRSGSGTPMNKGKSPRATPRTPKTPKATPRATPKKYPASPTACSNRSSRAVSVSNSEGLGVEVAAENIPDSGCVYVVGGTEDDECDSNSEGSLQSVSSTSSWDTPTPSIKEEPLFEIIKDTKCDSSLTITNVHVLSQCNRISPCFKRDILLQCDGSVVSIRHLGKPKIRDPLGLELQTTVLTHPNLGKPKIRDPLGLELQTTILTHPNLGKPKIRDPLGLELQTTVLTHPKYMAGYMNCHIEKDSNLQTLVIDAKLSCEGVYANAITKTLFHKGSGTAAGELPNAQCELIIWLDQARNQGNAGSKAYDSTAQVVVSGTDLSQMETDKQSESVSIPKAPLYNYWRCLTPVPFHVHTSKMLSTWTQIGTDNLLILGFFTNHSDDMDVERRSLSLSILSMHALHRHSAMLDLVAQSDMDSLMVEDNISDIVQNNATSVDLATDRLAHKYPWKPRTGMDPNPKSKDLDLIGMKTIPTWCLASTTTYNSRSDDTGLLLYSKHTIWIVNLTSMTRWDSTTAETGIGNSNSMCSGMLANTVWSHTIKGASGSIVSIDVVGNIAINANYASTGETSSSKPKKSLCHIKMPERKTETPTHVSSVICCLDSYDNLILITTCTDYDYLNSISNSTATTNGLGVGFETPTANNVRSVNMTIPASHACGSPKTVVLVPNGNPNKEPYLIIGYAKSFCMYKLRISYTCMNAVSATMTYVTKMACPYSPEYILTLPYLKGLPKSPELVPDMIVANTEGYVGLLPFQTQPKNSLTKPSPSVSRKGLTNGITTTSNTMLNPNLLLISQAPPATMPSRMCLDESNIACGRNIPNGSYLPFPYSLLSDFHGIDVFKNKASNQQNGNKMNEIDIGCDKGVCNESSHILASLNSNGDVAIAHAGYGLRMPSPGDDSGIGIQSTTSMYVCTDSNCLLLGSQCGRISVYDSKSMALLRIINPPVKYKIAPSKQQEVMLWLDDYMYRTAHAVSKHYQSNTQATKKYRLKLKSHPRSYFENMIDSQNNVGRVQDMTTLVLKTYREITDQTGIVTNARLELIKTVYVVAIYEDGSLMIFDLGYSIVCDDNSGDHMGNTNGKIPNSHEVNCIYRSDEGCKPFIPKHAATQSADDVPIFLTKELFTHQHINYIRYVTNNKFANAKTNKALSACIQYSLVNCLDIMPIGDGSTVCFGFKTDAPVAVESGAANNSKMKTSIVFYSLKQHPDNWYNTKIADNQFQISVTASIDQIVDTKERRSSTENSTNTGVEIVLRQDLFHCIRYVEVNKEITHQNEENRECNGSSMDKGHELHNRTLDSFVIECFAVCDCIDAENVGVDANVAANEEEEDGWVYLDTESTENLDKHPQKAWLLCGSIALNNVVENDVWGLTSDNMANSNPMTLEMGRLLCLETGSNTKGEVPFPEQILCGQFNGLFCTVLTNTKLQVVDMRPYVLGKFQDVESEAFNTIVDTSKGSECGGNISKNTLSLDEKCSYIISNTNTVPIGSVDYCTTLFTNMSTMRSAIENNEVDAMTRVTRSIIRGIHSQPILLELPLDAIALGSINWNSTNCMLLTQQQRLFIDEQNNMSTETHALSIDMHKLLNSNLFTDNNDSIGVNNSVTNANSCCIEETPSDGTHEIEKTDYGPPINPVSKHSTLTAYEGNCLFIYLVYKNKNLNNTSIYKVNVTEQLNVNVTYTRSDH